MRLEAPQHGGSGVSSLCTCWQLCREMLSTELGWAPCECRPVGGSPATCPLPAASEGRSAAASEVARAGLAGNSVSWSCFPRGGSWSRF